MNLPEFSYPDWLVRHQKWLREFEALRADIAILPVSRPTVAADDSITGVEANLMWIALQRANTLADLGIGPTVMFRYVARCPQHGRITEEFVTNATVAARIPSIECHACRTNHTTHWCEVDEVLAFAPSDTPPAG